jgi:TetR/AcrR family transcriptional regulator, transcriptional repressor for nem operon
MVRVSRDQAAANRQALVTAAGRLFRQKGIDGVGVAELCEAAGMTHGALYSHFGCKEDLVTEAFVQGQAASSKRLDSAVGLDPDISTILDFYVSRRQRDNAVDCCPLLASASEAARQSKPTKRAFAAAFDELSATVAMALGKRDPRSDARAMVIAASMIGTVAVARALDPAQSDALIEAAREVLGALSKAPVRASKSSKESSKGKAKH